jgi:hypothetical protein
MSVVFPNNNLPTSSQPWGREVTKQLTNIIASSASSQINNAARDNQLNSSIIALTGVVTDVQTAAQEANDAITGLTSLGSDGSPYSIYANNISGGTITGVTLQSASSGQRVAINGTNIGLYNSSNELSGTINGESQAGFPTLIINNGSSEIDMRNNYLQANGGSNSLLLSGTTASLTGSNTFIGGDNITLLSQGSIFTQGTISSSGNIRAPGITSTTFLQAENHAGGGTTGASINNNGTIIRTSSSERYKQDIEGLSVDYNDLLSLEPKRFRLKEEAAENPDARYYAGFIAEEIDQTSLRDFVAYRTMQDGSVVPDGVYYGELTAALLEAIKHQDTLIKSLTDRISVLEGDKVE